MILLLLLLIWEMVTAMRMMDSQQIRIGRIPQCPNLRERSAVNFAAMCTLFPEALPRFVARIAGN